MTIRIQAFILLFFFGQAALPTTYTICLSLMFSADSIWLRPIILACCSTISWSFRIFGLSHFNVINHCVASTRSYLRKNICSFPLWPNIQLCSRDSPFYSVAHCCLIFRWFEQSWSYSDRELRTVHFRFSHVPLLCTRLSSCLLVFLRHDYCIFSI